MPVPIIHCGVCMLREEMLIVQQAVTTEEGFLFESIIGRLDAFAISDSSSVGAPDLLALLVNWGPCP